MWTDAEILAALREKLGDFRYGHSLAVAACARELAERYGANAKKAYTAGLLHDAMKDSSPRELTALFARYGVVLLPEERAAPQLWHAIAGEVFARYSAGVRDQEILYAIRYHTTGRAGMGPLEKIIFTADFISADRVYDGVERMREKAGVSLELAMAEGFQFTMQRLLERERVIHPDMLRGYNEIILEKENNE